MCEGNNVEQTETIGPLTEKQTICIIRARMFSRLGLLEGCKRRCSRRYRFAHTHPMKLKYIYLNPHNYMNEKLADDGHHLGY